MAAIADTVARKGRKYDQVLDGARRVFLRDGFEGASVDDIAREAGVSKATLYSYFPDKRLLFTEICQTECRRQTEEAEAALPETAPIEAQLTFAAERIAGFLTSDFGRNMFRLVVAEGIRFPDLARAFYENGPGLVTQRVAHHMRQMVDAGALDIDDVPLAAEQFVQLCKARIQDRLLFGMSESITPEDIRKTAQGAVRMFLAAHGTQNISPKGGAALSPV